MTAACGHEIDFPFPSKHVICKACFEAQGFQYNRNSYADIQRGRQGSAASGMGTALRGVEPPDVRKAEIAAILNPHIGQWQKPGGRTQEGIVARRAALALIKERFGINRQTAYMYAKEFRTAA